MGGLMSVLLCNPYRIEYDLFFVNIYTSFDVVHHKLTLFIGFKVRKRSSNKLKI